MSLLPGVLLCGGLLWVFAQDVKERAIHVFMLPLLAGLLLWLGLGRLSLEVLTSYCLINAGFIMFLLLSVFLYLRMRYGAWVNPFAGYFGLGDALFWAVLAIAFSPLNFIVFQVLSLTASLVMHMLLRPLKGYGDGQKVPLAGLQALVLLVSFLTTGAFFYNDQVILTLIFS